MNRQILSALLATFIGSAPALGAGLILNEFNAVGAGKVLDNGGTDSFFGTVDGNGGNWVELVVTADHLDARGWVLDWSNGDPDAGTVTFTTNALWSDLRSGAIITIREDDTGDAGVPVGARPTDVSFNPLGGDWWIEINVDDPTYVSNGGFKVDNDGWQGRILDDVAVVQQDFVGEDVAGWGGGGINSQEVGLLTLSPSVINPSNGDYDDGDNSSYGMVNSGQDFGALRAWVPEPSSFVLAAIAACGLVLNMWRRRRAG